MTTHNLRPFNTLTEDEQRKIATNGGIASGISRKKKKVMKEVLLELLDSSLDGKKTLRETICSSILQQALKGNIKAFECIRDTIGEKPSSDPQAETPLELPQMIITPVQKIYVSKDE